MFDLNYCYHLHAQIIFVTQQSFCTMWKCGKIPYPATFTCMQSTLICTLQYVCTQSLHVQKNNNYSKCTESKTYFPVCFIVPLFFSISINSLKHLPLSNNEIFLFSPNKKGLKNVLQNLTVL